MADIDAVNRALPDFIGFVFAPSRRRVDSKTAAALKEKLDPQIKTVGVFVNERIEIVAELYQNGIIDMAQLHGDEDDEYIRQLKKKCPVIKAVGVCTALPALPLEPDYLLFDTVSAQRGGSGKAFDWHILNGYRGLPFFLAGGLSMENAADAIHTLNPFCVDVSSSVETDGLKDPDKIEKIVSCVREITQ